MAKAIGVSWIAFVVFVMNVAGIIQHQLHSIIFYIKTISKFVFVLLYIAGLKLDNNNDGQQLFRL